MKSALINRWFDLRGTIDPNQSGWLAIVMYMWRIEAILQDRYGYDIALNGEKISTPWTI
jgi:hypothetical protein